MPNASVRMTTSANVGRRWIVRTVSRASLSRFASINEPSSIRFVGKMPAYFRAEGKHLYARAPQPAVGTLKRETLCRITRPAAVVARRNLVGLLRSPGDNLNSSSLWSVA